MAFSIVAQGVGLPAHCAGGHVAVGVIAVGVAAHLRYGMVVGCIVVTIGRGTLAAQVAGASTIQSTLYKIMRVP